MIREMFTTASSVSVEREQVRPVDGDFARVRVQMRGVNGSGRQPVTITQPVLSKTAYHASDRDNMDPEQENEERLRFYHDLHDFMSSVGQPIQRLPTLGEFRPTLKKPTGSWF